MEFKLINILLVTCIISTSAFSNIQTTSSTASLLQTSKQPVFKGSIIQFYDKDFNFDWNNYTTIAPNHAKLERIEAFLKTNHSHATLSASDQKALGKLLYKLGTFYTHVLREPDLAIEKMNLAQKLLVNKEDKAWNDNHLAYAYEQKFAVSKLDADKNKSLYYINQVISTLYSNKSNKEVAFAYCVKGLVQNDAKEYMLAENSFKKALAMYEAMPNGKDDQYARAKNRLADIILEQNGRDQESLAMLLQLKKYWVEKKNASQSPYAARNLISLGKAYLKTNNAQAARDEFDSAILIYTNIYGSNSSLLAKPYQLLSETYKKLGNLEQASIYIEKANSLNKS